MLQPIDGARGRFLSRARLEPAPLSHRPQAWLAQMGSHLPPGALAGMAALLLAALWAPLSQPHPAVRTGDLSAPRIPRGLASEVRHVSLPAQHAAIAIVGSPGGLPVPNASPDVAPPVAALDERMSGAADGVSSAMAPAAASIVAAPAAWWPDSALDATVRGAIPDGIGRVAVSVRHLRTGASADVEAAAVMPPASLYKLGVMVVAFQEIEAGRLALGERLWITDDDWLPGAGVLQARVGESVTVAEALRLMIGISDNTAASVLLRRIGADAVNEEYVQEGLAQTRLYPDWRPDTTTAAETAHFLVDLATGQLAGAWATQQMLDLLAQEQPSAWIVASLPADEVVAHKSGQLVGVRNDAAIVFGRGGPYVLTVLTDDLDDDAVGETVIGAVAAAVDDYFRTPLPSAEDTLVAHLER